MCGNFNKGILPLSRFVSIRLLYDCNLIFSSLTLKNGLKKHVRNVAKITFTLNSTFTLFQYYHINFVTLFMIK